MANGRQVFQDPMGFSRLAQALRLNRQEKRQAGIDAQNVELAGLQRQGLELGLQQQKSKLAQLQQAEQLKQGIRGAIQQGKQVDPNADEDKITLDYLSVNAPGEAQAFKAKIFEQSLKRVQAFGAEDATNFYNSKTGENVKFVNETDSTFTVDTGGAFEVLRKRDGKTIRTIKKTAAPKSESKKFQLKEGTDEKGNPIQFNYDSATGKIFDLDGKPLKNVRPKLSSNETIESLPGGGFRITRGTGGDKQKKFSEVQTKAGGFADRVVRSNKILNDLEDTEGFEPATLFSHIAASIPLGGNALLSQDKQRYEQAKRDFVTAVLRLESGAVISDSEFETEGKKYFPQVGDGPDVIAQKREARNRQFDILRTASAGHFDEIQKTRKKRMDSKKVPVVEETKKVKNVSDMSDDELLEALNAK